MNYYKNLPDEIILEIFNFVNWKCHCCNIIIHPNNIYYVINKCNSKSIFCSKSCYEFI